jgi:hypothetical protein
MTPAGAPLYSSLMMMPAYVHPRSAGVGGLAFRVLRDRRRVPQGERAFGELIWWQ